MIVVKTPGEQDIDIPTSWRPAEEWLHEAFQALFDRLYELELKLDAMREEKHEETGH